MIVLGDFLQDEDVWLRTARKSPEGDWPVVVKQRPTDRRPGGAGAVVQMVRAMGADVFGVGEFAKPACIKRRFFVDDKQVFRFDIDTTAEIPNNVASHLVTLIPAGSLVLVADYGKGVVTEHLWRQLTTRTDRIIVDPSRHRPLEWYQGAMGIVPNRTESKVSLLSESIERCHQLRQMFSRVCIKLDRDGMVVSSSDGAGHIPAECTEPIDVCGAGDMTLAGIGVGLTRGMNWLESCRFANHMAGLKCRQHGATAVNYEPISDCNFLTSSSVKVRA